MNGRTDPGWGAAVLAAAILAASLCGAAAQTAIRVGKAVPASFTFIPLDVGIEAGIFKKHGLDVQASAFGGAARMQQALAADGIDIGVGGGADFAFIAKGAPVLAIAVLAQPPALFSILVAKNGPIAKLDDLKGKIVSVSTTGSITEWLVKELARRQGWGPDGMKTLGLGAENAQFVQLKTGQIAAMISDMATAYRLEEAGEVRILYRFGNAMTDYIAGASFARRDYIKDHPENVRKFLAGWYETIAYMREHKPETVKVTARVAGVSEAIAGRTYDELMPAFSGTGRFEPAALATMARSIVELKLLPEAPDLKPMYTEDFLPK